MRYSSYSDRFVLFLAYLFSSLWGATMPASVLFFGEMIDSIATIETASESLEFQAKAMAMVGVVSFIGSWVQITFFSYFAETVAHKCKVDYFAKTITKDSKWFDSNNPG